MSSADMPSQSQENHLRQDDDTPRPTHSDVVASPPLGRRARGGRANRTLVEADLDQTSTHGVPRRRRSLGSRKSISRTSQHSQPKVEVSSGSVLHLADLGKRHTADHRSEASRLRKAVLKGASASQGHSQQPSISSRPSSDTNHQPVWLSSNVWVNEIKAINDDMAELEKQYKSGELRAFGRHAQETFDQLDALRHDQQSIFQKHIEMEKSILEELGQEVPDVELMESEGFEPFGNDDAAGTTSDLLLDMSKLCQKIESTNFNRAGQMPSSMSSPGKRDSTPQDTVKTPLTREALDKLDQQGRMQAGTGPTRNIEDITSRFRE